MVNWGEKPKRRLVIQAENDEEAQLLREFAAKAKRNGRTQKWFILGWITAFLAKESEK